MEEFIPKEDIKSYLMAFVAVAKMPIKSKDGKVEPESIDRMAEAMIYLINSHLESKLKLFGQVLPDACRTCPLKYSETGRVTKKEYFYCIRTDDSSLNVSVDCPERGTAKKFEVVNETDNDVILDIRERYRKRK